MKKYFLFFLLSSPLYASNCNNAVTTPDINQCAKIEQEKVEVKLNLTYQDVIKRFSVPDTKDDKPSEIKESLVKAQRAWLKFREADCHAVYVQNQGGTIRTAMYIGCMQARAEQRIKELKQFDTNL
ncbi:MAG: lysozyme inhibitor LprI family protein [Pseudomonadota bacterium]